MPTLYSGEVNPTKKGFSKACREVENNIDDIIPRYSIGEEVYIVQEKNHTTILVGPLIISSISKWWDGDDDPRITYGFVVRDNPLLMTDMYSTREDFVLNKEEYEKVKKVRIKNKYCSGLNTNVVKAKVNEVNELEYSEDVNLFEPVVGLSEPQVSSLNPFTPLLWNKSMIVKPKKIVKKEPEKNIEEIKQLKKENHKAVYDSLIEDQEEGE